MESKTTSAIAVFIIWALTISALLQWPSCSKEPTQTPCERINGAWRQTFSPHSIYTFADGLCTWRVYVTGNEVYRNEVVYDCEGDNLKVKYLSNGNRETWHLNFEADSTVLIDTGGEINIELKRFK